MEENRIIQNNVSPGESNIESNPSSNDSEQMKKLNERLNQFINNNFNYTYSNNNISQSGDSNENDIDYLAEEDKYGNTKKMQNILSTIMRKESSPKSFINNKLNSVPTNSNLTEKLHLYNLFSSNKGQRDCVNNSDNVYEEDWSLNKIFDQDTIEKYFQKEVIRFTIENFCKYIKDNGYTIIKNGSEEDAGKKKEMVCPHRDKKHYAKVLFFNSRICVMHVIISKAGLRRLGFVRILIKHIMREGSAEIAI
jgi:hypothetical protein